MTMSIAHRVTGGALYFGTVLFAAWLVALAMGADAFSIAQAVVASPIGLLVLFGYTWALIHHALGGLRHFFWDFGIGLDKPARDRIALATIVGSVAITIVVWVVGLLIR